MEKSKRFKCFYMTDNNTCTAFDMIGCSPKCEKFKKCGSCDHIKDNTCKCKEKNNGK